MIPEPKEEYECPHCGEWFEIDPEEELYTCKVCNSKLMIHRDADFVDGIWHNLSRAFLKEGKHLLIHQREESLNTTKQ